MSQTVTVKNVVFGEGHPKIAIPLTAPDLAGLEQALEALQEGPCDLIEWRGGPAAPPP